MGWETTSQVATTIGVAVAGVSALLALVTYRAQVEAQADAHMHGLFNGYLSALLDAKADPDALETLKLYVLEEMLDWVRDQQRSLCWWFWSRPLSLRRRWKELKQWEATIEGNLEDPCQVLKRIDRDQSKAAYGDEFRAFVKRCCETASKKDAAG